MLLLRPPRRNELAAAGSETLACNHRVLALYQLPKKVRGIPVSATHSLDQVSNKAFLDPWTNSSDTWFTGCIHVEDLGFLIALLPLRSHDQRHKILTENGRSCDDATEKGSAYAGRHHILAREKEIFD